MLVSPDGPCAAAVTKLRASVRAWITPCHRDARKIETLGWSGPFRMSPLVDPRLGDIEDDASSTKRRSLLGIAGSLLAEISIPKLLTAWLSLIVLPGVLLGLAPLIASGWLATLSGKIATPLDGIVAAPAARSRRHAGLDRRTAPIPGGGAGLLVPQCVGSAAGLRALPRGAATSGRAFAEAAARRSGAHASGRGDGRRCRGHSLRDPPWA